MELPFPKLSTMDISQEVEQIEENINSLNDFNPQKETKLHHKMNILSRNHFDPEANKRYIVVREFGTLSSDNIIKW